MASTAHRPPCDCNWFERAAAEPGVPIAFDELVNEYHIVWDGPHGAGMLVMNYCPFCGGRAPASRRQELFAHVPEAEEDRLNELVRDIKSLDDALRVLGAPDIDMPTGMAAEREPKHGEAPTREVFRVLLYKRLSDVADVRIVESPEGGVRRIFSAKPIRA